MTAANLHCPYIVMQLQSHGIYGSGDWFKKPACRTMSKDDRNQFTHFSFMLHFGISTRELCLWDSSERKRFFSIDMNKWWTSDELNDTGDLFIILYFNREPMYLELYRYNICVI